MLCLLSCFILVSSGCSKSTVADSIQLEIWHNGSPVDCNTFESEQQVWTIEQLAFFISQMKLSGEDAKLQPQLSATPWQTDDVVLIQPNLTDCATKIDNTDKVEPQDNATAKTLKSNSRVPFSQPVDLDSFQQLSFTLAVPFALNHQNPLIQPSPLNLPSMFWSWRSGHKFFRLDIQSPESNWVFHLGSVGCAAVSTMRSPETECLQPNRVNFKLDKKHDGTKLVMHLDRLLANTSLQTSESCLFHSNQQSCTILMSNLKTQEVFEWH